MASQAELRAMMRRAAPVRHGTVASKLARYEADGRLACRVCNRVLGDDDALWDPHLLSAGHAEAVAALKSKVVKPALSSAVLAPGPGVPKVTPSAAASASAGLAPGTAPRTGPPVQAPAAIAPGPIGAHVTLTGSAPPRPTASAVPGPQPRSLSVPAEAPAAAAERAAPDPKKAAASAAALLNTSASTAARGGAFGRGGRGGAAGAGAPVTAPTPAAGAAALPAGFFDDVEKDLVARGLDPKAIARAALEREWAEFQEFAAVVDAAEEERAAAEAASYEDQQAAAAAENALYRSRLDVVRFVQQRLMQRGLGDGGAAAAATAGVPGGAAEAGEGELAPTDEVLVAELAGPLSLLTTPDAGVQTPGAADIARLMAAQRPAPAAAAAAAESSEAGSEDDAEDDDDLLDWRSKAPKRVRR